MRAIAKTVFPDNYRKYIETTGKEADKRFNQWTDYIAGIKPENLPKKGGVCFEDESEDFLNEMKNHLALSKRL